MLRGWLKLPFAIVNRQTGATQFLPPDEFEALLYCDGEIDVDSLVPALESIELIALAREKGLVEASETPSPIQEYQRHHIYPARYIKSAHWSVTGRCNYRCRHCYMSAPDAKYGELSHEQCMSIIDQLHECGVMNVSLTGGEPMVRKDFMSLVDALLKRHINITTIYSNGKLVTPELLDALDAHGVKPEFNMSFDGVGWHDWLRGVPGAEKAVTDAFTLCRKRGFPTGAELTLHRKNRHTLRESVNLLASLGVAHLKTNPAAPSGAWIENAGEDSLSYEDTYDIYLKYIPRFFEDGSPMDVHLGGFFKGNKGSMEYFISAWKYGGDPSAAAQCICGHARLNMYIAADGRTLPCMALSGLDVQKDFPMITELGLKECITNSYYMSLIDTRLECYLGHNPRCAACGYKYICGGGCRANALTTSPDILSPDEAICRIFTGGYVEKIEQAAAEAGGIALHRKPVTRISS